MNTSLLAAATITVAVFGIAPAALAQAPNTPDRANERSRTAEAERKCDALTGLQKEQCLRDARRMPDSAAQGPSLRGSCDGLIGPEKELCLKRGGTIEAGAKSRAGSAGGAAK